MAKYLVRATDRNGKHVYITVEADSAANAEHKVYVSRPLLSRPEARRRVDKKRSRSDRKKLKADW